MDEVLKNAVERGHVLSDEATGEWGGEKSSTVRLHAYHH